MGTAVTLSGLPSIGACAYGGVQFEELFTSKVIGNPEWDRANRSVKYVRYMLELDGYVLSRDGTANDPTWSRLRYILQQPGLALRYSGRGFGNLNVNVNFNGGLVDVCNGPKPKILEFTPMGAPLAARIIWRCEVCLPEITAAPTIHLGNASAATTPAGVFQAAFPQGVLAFNWGTSLTFPEDGYAIYNVSGELEIARVFGRPDNLESYRAYTEPQLPVGFKPTKRDFKTDDAKRQIRFDYSYEELPPMGLPVRCTEAGGRYRVSCGSGPALVRWTANLQANYTVVPTGPRREAYMRFLGLLRDRIDHVRRTASLTVASGSGTAPVPGGGGGGIAGGSLNPFTTLRTAIGNALNALSPGGGGGAIGTGTRTFNGVPGVTNPPVGSGAYPLIRTFVIDEGLYEDSKSSSFECSWTFFTSFSNVFRACGAWRKMNDCAGQLRPDGRDVWMADMAAILGHTSWYNYGFRPNAEIVVSPNTERLGPFPAAMKGIKTGHTIADSNRVTAGAGLVRTGIDPDSGESPDAEVRVPGMPSPEASWLNYQIDFITELDPGVALHKVLPQRDDPVDSLGSVDPLASRPDADSTHGINTVSKSTGEDVLQRMATSTYRVALRGYGVRAGYKVPVPDLRLFGGSAVSPGKQRTIGPRVVANYSGVPIYLTAWLLWYDVPKPPKAVQPALPDLAQKMGDLASPPKEIQVPVSVPERQPTQQALQQVGAGVFFTAQ